MKRSRIVLWAGVIAFVGVWVALNVHPAGSESDGGITWHSFTEGVTAARTQQKFILVDVYTDWCGWCKKMDREVYTDARVRDILQERFVAVKLNAESSEPLEFNSVRMSEAQFARTVGVTGYPTTLFLDERGAVVTILPGYLPAEQFVRVLTFVAEGHYKQQRLDDFLSRGS